MVLSPSKVVTLDCLHSCSPSIAQSTMVPGHAMILLASTTYAAAQDIVFPTHQASASAQFNLSIPTSSEQKVEDLTKFVPAGCDDNDYCEDSLDYPDEETVMEIVKNVSNPALVQMLFTQIGFLAKQDEYVIEPKIAKTIIIESDKPTKMLPDDLDDDYDLILMTPLCHTVENFVFPKTAKTRSSQWRWSHASKHNFLKYLQVCDQPAFC